MKLAYYGIVMLTISTTLCHKDAAMVTPTFLSRMSKTHHALNGLKHATVGIISAYVCWKTLTFSLDKNKNPDTKDLMVPERSKDFIAVYPLRSIFLECLDKGGVYNALRTSKRLEGDVLLFLGFTSLVASSSRIAYAHIRAAHKSFTKAWNGAEQTKEDSALFREKKSEDDTIVLTEQTDT
ncbi:hypothetical protein H0W26_05880 [Candidatus Dependentiae bacterium]|nr:hypothetical protein [Candidatus Dependentiae bacterium]